MPPRKPTYEKKAGVNVVENTPVGGLGRSDQMLIAQEEDRMVVSAEKDGAGVTTTHQRPGTLIMYKPTERSGYVPRTVSASAIRLLLNQGWKEVCPECSDRHLDKNGVDSTDPNLCAAREPVALRICPVCQKRIYDHHQFANVELVEGEEDPNLIQDDTFANTTGAERTRASLDLHIWLRHPRQAQMMALPPLPTALRDMVEGSRKAG